MKAFIKGRLWQTILIVAVLWIAAVYVINGDFFGKIKSDKNLNGNVLSVEYIDVGQGDSTFITFDDGENLLIDGGSDNSMAYNYLKKNKVESIDYVVATHPHEDHIGGLAEICENLSVNAVYLPDVSASTKIYNRFLKSLDNGKTDVNVAKKGVTIKEDDDLKVEILSPVLEEYDNLNDYSAVVKITYRDVSFLFTGDCETTAEEKLDMNAVKSDVLKVGHHGSKTSSSPQFINAVKPKYAIVSVGENNSYGHPNDKVLNRLHSVGAKIYRTDEEGNITVTTDGTNIEVSAE